MTEEISTAGDGELTAALVGSILGGLVGGLVLYLGAPNHLAFVGAPLGFATLDAAFGVWLGFAVALGLGFAAVATPTFLAGGSHSSSTTRPSYSIRATGLGLLYGLGAGIVVGAAAVPALVGLTTGSNPPVPLVSTSVIVGYAAFGLVLGLGYGLTLEGRIPVPSLWFIGRRLRAVVVAPLLAGVLSGALVYLAQPAYLRFISAAVADGSPGLGFVAWVGLTFVLGVVFAATGGRPAARGSSTTGYGFVYGVVLAVFVGLLAIPALVTATTEWELGFGHVALSTLGAFMLYGVVLGSTYGKVVNRQPLRPAFLVGRSRAIALSSLLGGVVAGGLFYVLSPVTLLYFAEFVGVGGSLGVGFAAWLVAALAFGAVFATYPARRIDRETLTRKTGTNLGFAYGVLLAVVVGMFVTPAAIESLTVFPAESPFVNGGMLVGYVVFGLLLGSTYGSFRDETGTLPVFLQGRTKALVTGAVLGGAVGAAVVYVSVPQPFYFAILGALVGTPSVPVGVGVWFVVALLLGVLFIPLAGSMVEYRPGLLRGAGVGTIYGAVLTATVGVVGMPAVAISREIGLDLPHLAPPIAGYLAFGIVFGAVYGRVQRGVLTGQSQPTPTTVGTAGQRAVVFGSIFGGAVGGLIIHHMLGVNSMLYFGALVGYGGSVGISWAVWFSLSLLLGTLFAVVVGSRLDAYARALAEAAERNDDVELLVGDRLDRAPLTTAAALAGVAYGVVVAIAVGAIAVPVLVNTVTEFGLFVPTLRWSYLLAFVAYGAVLGTGYGVMREF